MAENKLGEFLLNRLGEKLGDENLDDISGGKGNVNAEVELDWQEAETHGALSFFKKDALEKFEKSFPDEHDRTLKVFLNLEVGDDKSFKDVDMKFSLIGKKKNT